MTSKGPSIAPRSAPSPIAISPAASSPPTTTAISLPGGKTAANSAARNLEGNSSPNVTQIITSKEWVLPPRPKPGRKPSVDTPASKRKAQNRAAQRAFRERRATRVQELEQKLMEVEKDKEVREMGLVNTINKLKLENQVLLKNMEQLKAEIAGLKEQGPFYSASPAAPSPTSMPPNRSYFKPAFSMHSPSVSAGAGSPASSSYSVQQISPAPSTDSPPTYKKHNHKQDNFDCGICLKDDCLCETVGLKLPEAKAEDVSKLADIQPMAAVSLKRKPKQMETDFTGKFKPKQMPDLKRLKKAEPQFNESSPVDNCGFCSDDTPCVCREAAKEAARLNDSLNESRIPLDEDHENKKLPPIINHRGSRQSVLPVMHPGPSVEIQSITNLTPGAVPTVVGSTESKATLVEVKTETSDNDGGCTGNPGTCRQCQMDPLSTLFCTTVASKVERNQDKSSPENSASPQPNRPRSDSRSDLSAPRSSMGMPGTPSSSAPPPLIATSNPATSTSGMFIPCADAYKTLSRHKKFNSVDFSTLVGKLTTRGMQVEVQSVANVLRELDRRLHN